MTPDQPADPLTSLAAAAVQMHELFTAWVSAGFTDAQAMQLLCALLAAGLARP